MKYIIIEPKISDITKFLFMFAYVKPDYAKFFNDIIESIALTRNPNFISIIIERFLIILQEIMQKRNLKKYHAQIKECNIIKGKVLITESLKTLDFLNQKWVCNFDEFTNNILENQIIKYTLYLLKPIASEVQIYKINQYLDSDGKY